MYTSCSLIHQYHYWFYTLWLSGSNFPYTQILFTIATRGRLERMSFSYYPKNFHANGWGWHRTTNTAKAVRGFLNRERDGEHSSDLVGNGSLYPTLPSEDDSSFSGVKLYPALPVEEYEGGAVEEVVEEDFAAVKVNLDLTIWCRVRVESICDSMTWILVYFGE
ncbi:unnamed protein product [Leptosia nina]|uniref:Uncharacterized protein n=1 Tax=Leptosia nina TaxID=320188 RepID=A0AAV1JLR0_9NEOP